jgi:hypothetical protein
LGGQNGAIAELQQQVFDDALPKLMLRPAEVKL